MTLIETPGALPPGTATFGRGRVHNTDLSGFATAENAAKGPSFDAEEALRFIGMLGMDPATAWFRSIKPGGKTNTRRRGRDLAGFDPDELSADSAAGAGLYLISGDAVAATGVSKKTGQPTACVQDSDISTCRALFAEWDDKPVEWQLTAWRDLGLPEPTAQNHTGGKSIHNWWVLEQAIDPQLWRDVIARLIEYCQSDKKCSNPSRLMRLPGSVYYDKKTGEAIGRAKIVGGSGNRVALTDILAALPPEAPTVAPEAPQAEQRHSTRLAAGDLPPRGLGDIRAAARCIPKRVVGGGNYDPSRHALCGCSAAIAATGKSDAAADAMALDLLAPLWPSRATAKQVLDSSTTRDPAAFWSIAGGNGYDLKRSDLAAGEQSADNGEEGKAISKKAKRLRPDEVLELLPTRVKNPRLNIRSGDIETADGPILANDAMRLYLRLSSPSEVWGKEVTIDALASIAQAAAFDPVKEYLEGIKVSPLPIEQWQRLDSHLLGIDDPIAANFLPQYLISAVARVFEPGCSVRRSPVLIGPQWRGKTALGRILFGADVWVEGVRAFDRDARLRCHTAWGVELAELNGVSRRADQETLKAFLTETTDVERRPYDRAPEKMPRRFVFWGTANAAPLRDATGSTRFVCIPIPDRMLPLDWATEHRDQLWARALEQYRAGVEWDRQSDESRRLTAERNANHQEIDPWAGPVIQALQEHVKWESAPVPLLKLFEQLEVEPRHQTNAQALRIRAIAESDGWVLERRRCDRGRVSGFWPPEDPAPGHPGHPLATPPATPANANGANGSQVLATPATPKRQDQNGIRGDRGAGSGSTPAIGSTRTHSSRFGVAGVANRSDASDSKGSAGVAGGVARPGRGGQADPPPPWLPVVLELRRRYPDKLPAELVNSPDLAPWRHLTGGMVKKHLAQFDAGEWPELRTQSPAGQAGEL
jgi:hypothetical protein